MVVFSIDAGIRKLADVVLVKTTFLAGVLWFNEDIKIILSSSDVLATIVVDFDIQDLVVVQYTVNGGIDFVDFNNGEAVNGRQSRYIDVTDGALVNFRVLAVPVDVVRVAVCRVP